MRWLNYHHLFYFQAIATEGSIAKASGKLRLGQPTLSAQLKLLEESLGISLFHRKNKKLILTEEGRMVLNYANHIFSAGSELLEVIKDRSFTKRVHLQVGILESLPKKLIKNLVRFVQRDKCTITILEGECDLLFRELCAHRIDVVLSNFTPHVGGIKQYVTKLLGEVPVAVFGTKRFRHLKTGFPESLRNQPFILPTLHSKLRHDLDHYFRVNSISVDVAIECQDTSVQKILGVDGMGLVPLPEFAGEELVSEKKLIKIGTLPGVMEDIWIISSVRKISNPLAEALMNHFKLDL